MKIHNDSEGECGVSTYRSFLCDSPLIYEKRGEEEERSVLLGAFHQHYLVDGKIVGASLIFTL